MEVEFGCVGIPLSVKVIVVELWLSALSLLCEVDLVWLSAYPSKCRGD